MIKWAVHNRRRRNDKSDQNQRLYDGACVTLLRVAMPFKCYFQFELTVGCTSKLLSQYSGRAETCGIAIVLQLGHPVGH
jgi:hypothetical protein